MAKDEPVVKVKKIRDELIKIANEVKAGKLTPSVSNAITNTLRTALYAEQIRSQLISNRRDLKIELEGCTRLSKADRERLDSVVELLSGEIKEG